MCRAMIGIDGGGTKTEFILFTQNGVILKRLVKEGCNPNTSGIEKAIEVLKRGIDSLLEVDGEVVGIFVGGSGFASGGQGKVIERELSSYYKPIKIRCESDAFNLIACSSNPDKCLAVICGTGSVVYANQNGILRRFGGGGYLIDQGGSGYHIGRDALSHALYERDGIAPKSLITELVEEKLKADVWSSIQDVYQGNQSFIASFALDVFKAYEKGDEVAAGIIERNAEVLSGLLTSAFRLCDIGNTVIFSGSVVTKSKVFLDKIKKNLPSEIQIEVLDVPQVYGACVLCCKLCGVDIQEFKVNFKAKYKEDMEC